MHLEKFLKEIALFSFCTPEELKLICHQASSKRYNEGDLIIKEGSVADTLYIIIEGTAQVYTKDKGGSLLKLATLEEGNYFGEQGYLNNGIRTVSVKAVSDMQVIELSYDILDSIFNKSDKLRHFLKKASLGRSITNLQTQLHAIDSYVKKEIFFQTDKTHLKSFKKGEIIFNKGDTFDYVYFITAGSVSLHFEDHSIMVSKGHIFGELGVLKHQPRAATAEAASNTSIIAITGNDFLNGFNKTVGLKSLILAFENAYSLPKHHAIVEQYVSKQNDGEAIFTRYKLPNEKSILCAKTIDQNKFIIKNPLIKPNSTWTYQKENFIERTIGLKDQELVEVNSIGPWEELDAITTKLLEGKQIIIHSPESFTKTGSLLSLF